MKTYWKRFLENPVCLGVLRVIWFYLKLSTTISAALSAVAWTFLNFLLSFILGVQSDEMLGVLRDYALQANPQEIATVQIRLLVPFYKEQYWMFITIFVVVLFVTKRKSIINFIKRWIRIFNRTREVYAGNVEAINFYNRVEIIDCERNKPIAYIYREIKNFFLWMILYLFINIVIILTTEF